MTGKRLHALRPEARYAPYLGLQERVSGYVISYQFPTTMMESKATDITPEDRLQGVFISEVFDSMEKAQSTWRDRVGAVSSTHRAPTVCESFPTGGIQARWLAGKKVLAIGAFPREPMAPTVADRIVYAIAAADDMKQPAGATKIACPNS